MQSSLSSWRDAGQRIAFVPTMGNLHSGHLSLVKHAQELADRVVVSIFVNPRQFNNEEDFLTYPATESDDVTALQAVAVDSVFIPSVEEIFPSEGFEVISAGRLGGELCGAFRPGHFDGVLTVLVRLFKIVCPDIAVFGYKDYQQFCIVKNFFSSSEYGIEIVGAPTVRTEQGLALSSRNSRLTRAQMQQAPTLYCVLQNIASAIREGEDIAAAIKQGRDKLQKSGFRPEYIEVRRTDTLVPPATMDERPLVILAAAWLGKARLIDNLVLR